MADRLISADALYDEIKAISELPVIATDIVLNRIAYAPTIEAEPITTEKYGLMM